MNYYKCYFHDILSAEPFFISAKNNADAEQQIELYWSDQYEDINLTCFSYDEITEMEYLDNVDQE